MRDQLFEAFTLAALDSDVRSIKLRAAEEDDSPDFSKETPQTHVDVVALLPANESVWRDRVRKMAGSWLIERTRRPYAEEIRFDAIGLTFDAVYSWSTLVTSC